MTSHVDFYPFLDSPLKESNFYLFRRCGYDRHRFALPHHPGCVLKLEVKFFSNKGRMMSGTSRFYLHAFLIKA